LDVIDVLVGADPGWSGSQVWEVIGVDDELFVLWSHGVEVFRWLGSWDGVMSSLIEVIVDNLSKINDASFLDLNFRSLIELDS